MTTDREIDLEAALEYYKSVAIVCGFAIKELTTWADGEASKGNNPVPKQILERLKKAQTGEQ